MSILAKALDPRIQQLKFLSDELRSDVKAELLRWASAYPQKVNPSPPKKKITALDILLGEWKQHLTLAVMISSHSSLQRRQCMPHDTPPLDWWKQNESQYPLPAKVAAPLLYSPATSPPSERLFSIAGLTVTN